MAPLDVKIRKVTIVGVGLLGGSIGLSLRASEFDGQIVGVGRRQSSLDLAMEVGTVDAVTLDPAAGAAGADLIILATPVGSFERLMTAIKPSVKRTAIVTDVGSTKREVVAAGERVLGRGGPFVGSHPMAGSENRGPGFARADLFAGATCILTPTGRTPAAKVGRVEAMWRTLNMRTLRMTPAAHDKAVARVSHLPQVLASLLMLLPGDSDLDVAATGFRDATRLAGSDPAMWRDILMTNRKPIAAAIAAMGKRMAKLAGQVQAGDAAAIEKLFAAAKRRRERTLGRRFTDRRVAVE